MLIGVFTGRTCNLVSCVPAHLLCFLTVSDAIKAVRGLEIIGILLIGGAGLLAILKLFAMKNQDQLPKLSGASAIAAG